MAVTDSGETKKATATITTQEIDFVNLVNGIYIKTSAAVHIAFDREATTADFLLDSTDLVVELDVPCTTVNLITPSGTATVYIIGYRS